MQVCGRNASKINKIVGCCPQYDILFETLSVLEHLQFFASIKGVPPSTEETERMKAILRRLNLDGELSTFSSKLSGGMKRKLSLAISLLGNPKVIYLDEPTTSIDPQSRR